jgi:hypothetical protein
MPEEPVRCKGALDGSGVTGSFAAIACGRRSFGVQPNARNRRCWGGGDRKKSISGGKLMGAFIRRVQMGIGLLAAAACLTGLPAAAQEKSAQTQQAPAAAPAASPAPEAKPADVSSPDAIMAATYDVISGPPGERDWNRFYSLFMPDARLISTGKAKDGSMRIRSVTPEGYAKLAGDYFKQHGFFERESSRKSERYGNIMHIFSTYESRNAAADEKPFARGINSFQLYFDGKRWYVVTIFWLEETPDNLIPKEFLPQ